MVEHCETRQMPEFTMDVNPETLFSMSDITTPSFLKENMLPGDPTSNRLQTLSHCLASSSSIVVSPLMLACLCNRPNEQPNVIAWQVVNLKPEIVPVKQ